MYFYFLVPNAWQQKVKMLWQDQESMEGAEEDTSCQGEGQHQKSSASLQNFIDTYLIHFIQVTYTSKTSLTW